MGVVTGLRGFAFDPGDPSVGLFGTAWVHEDCPAWDTWVAGQDTPGDSLDQGEVIETPLAEVRVSPMTIRRWWMLTCTDCVQQVIVTDTDFDPDDEALIEAERDRFADEAAEAYADAALAAYDDDPSPYSGTYSET